MRQEEIIISHADLMSESSKWSYTIGERLGDESAKSRHFVQGATDAGHRDLLLSACDAAWSELLQVLSAYTVDGQCGCGCDYKCGCGDGRGVDRVNEGVVDEECGDYRVVLWFPDNTYPALFDNVRRLCRRYLTMKMRSEWELLTGQSPVVSDQIAEQSIRRLKVEINTRTTPGRVKGGWRYGE